MRITLKYAIIQLIIIIFIFTFYGCRGNRDENSVIPPVTAPLSRDYVGYGVITDSFTHVTVDPNQDSISLGYLRRGSLVRVVRRQSVKTEFGFQSWVLIEDPQYGWLREDVMDIYNTEGQARTASHALGN